MRKIEIALRLNNRLKEKYDSYHLELNPWLTTEEKEQLDDQIFDHIIQAGYSQNDDVMINIMNMTVNGFIKQVMKNKNPFIKPCTRDAGDIFDMDEVSNFYTTDIISKSDFQAFMIQQEETYKKEGKIHVHHNDEIHDITFYRKYVPEIIEDYKENVKKRTKETQEEKPKSQYSNKELEKQLFHPPTKPTKTVIIDKAKKPVQPKPKAEILEPMDEYIKKIEITTTIDTIKKILIALYKRKTKEDNEILVVKEVNSYSVNWRKAFPWVWKAYLCHNNNNMESPYTTLQELETKGAIIEPASDIIQALNEGKEGYVHFKTDVLEKN